MYKKSKKDLSEQKMTHTPYANLTLKYVTLSFFWFDSSYTNLKFGFQPQLHARRSLNKFYEKNLSMEKQNLSVVKYREMSKIRYISELF